MVRDVNNRAAENAAPLILQQALACGIINLPDVESQIQMATKQKYLKQHPYSIWQESGGTHLWCTYLPDEKRKHKRVLKKRKTREEIEDLVANYWGWFDNNPTVEDVFVEYNNHMRELKKVSESSLWRSRALFKKFFGEFKKKHIKDLTELEISDFLEAQISKYDLTAHEFSNLKGLMKGILRRAKKRGLIEIDVCRMMQELDVTDAQFRKTVVDDEKEVYYDDEMQAVIQYVYTHPRPVNLGIALMFVTGIRVGELCTLKWEDFDGLTFKVRRTESRYIKEDGKCVWEVKEFPKSRAGWRTVIVPATYQWILDMIGAQVTSEWAFTTDQGQRMRTATFRRQLYRINDKLGMPRKSPHKIRKTYCSILLDNNVDNNLITKQVGHVDINVTEGHYHRDRKNMEHKIHIFSNVPELISGY